MENFSKCEFVLVNNLYTLVHVLLSAQSVIFLIFILLLKMDISYYMYIDRWFLPIYSCQLLPTMPPIFINPFSIYTLIESKQASKEYKIIYQCRTKLTTKG